LLEDDKDDEGVDEAAPKNEDTVKVAIEKSL